MLQSPVVRRACLTIVSLTALGAGPGTAPIGAAPAEGAYGSAKSCASCHKTIHTYWSESAHAQSVGKASYRDALGAALGAASDKEAVRRGCVWCHAPTALSTGDYELKQAVTREAITCDFCHTVADVDLGNPDHPFRLEPGKVKRGPFQYAKSPAHDTLYSPLHRSSPLLCAACHEHRNAQGVAVLSTYSEWRDSPYPARGTLCQECHMPLVPGGTVAEGLGGTQRTINLHRMVGGSGYAQIRRGLELRIESLTRTSASADVQVVVTNARVGHAAPGGLSTKAIVLAVGVDAGSGELLHRRERVYRRDLLDAGGKTLSSVPDLFLRSASVGEDTRLRPQESRSERFTVPTPEGSKAIVVRLEYRDTSDATAGPKTTLVAEERRELTAR
jgi:hypothetical protein